jgi:exodeoxyribonuclease VII large subunit
MSPESEKVRKIYSLLDVANSIKSVFTKNYISSYWIKAEIAKLNLYPKSGHCYTDLVEKKDGEVKAQMRAIIWAGDFKMISEKFLQVTKEPLNDGMTILFMARIEFSPVHGISLIITDIEPSFTLGEMAKEKTATIEKLKAEGLFFNNINLPFPIIPKRIAVISVETSKGYRDFRSIIDNNSKKYVFQIQLFPSLLQGDKAVSSIVKQLDIIKKAKNQFDIVLIIRGGGGDIGLNCFDNYLLAREVADFPLPVITGIGHSTNETVVEMISNQNKITPTDVAYFLLQCFDNVSGLIDEYESNIIEFAENIIAFESQRLNENIRRYKTQSITLLKNETFRFELITSSAEKLIYSYLSNKKREFADITEKITIKPKQIVENSRMSLTGKTDFILLLSKQYFKNVENLLNIYHSKAKLLDPKNVLKRGYSITKFNGKAIKDSAQLDDNDLIETEFYSGRIKSIVKKK